MITATRLGRTAALAAAAVLVVAGCSADASDDETSSTPAAAGSVDLRMTVWTSNEDHLALFDSIAEAYRSEHPEIDHLREPAVRRLQHHAHHPDRRRERP
nr:hypothetical protein [Jiangella alkaliphila]